MTPDHPVRRHDLYSLSRLPAGGLGNKLFAWAAGALFAERNQCRHIVTGVHTFQLRQWMRSPQFSRSYPGTFLTERRFHFVPPWVPKFDMAFSDGRRLAERPGCYLFSGIPHWADFFGDLRDHRQLVRQLLQRDLRPEISAPAREGEAPVIAVHIRLGDFRVAPPDADFSKLGGFRTPERYFIDTIEYLRQQLGFAAPVTIFSDGSDEDLRQFLALPNVRRAPPHPAMTDILALSRARIIVLSAGSSFGYWAAFLSEAIVVNHYQHLHAPIRDAATNAASFEGGLFPDQPNPELDRALADLRLRIRD